MFSLMATGRLTEPIAAGIKHKNLLNLQNVPLHLHTTIFSPAFLRQIVWHTTKQQTKLIIETNHPTAEENLKHLFVDILN